VKDKATDLKLSVTTDKSNGEILSCASFVRVVRLVV